MRGPGGFLYIHSGGHMPISYMTFRQHNTGEWMVGQINVMMALHDIGPGATISSPLTRLTTTTGICATREGYTLDAPARRRGGDVEEGSEDSMAHRPHAHGASRRSVRQPTSRVSVSSASGRTWQVSAPVRWPSECLALLSSYREQHQTLGFVVPNCCIIHDLNAAKSLLGAALP